jgi:SPW repeat
MKRVHAPRISDRRPIAGAAIFFWIAFAPWVWGFAGSNAAVANHVALVFGFAPLALIMVNLRAAAIVTLLAALWLVASPWLLGYATTDAAWLNELVSGLTLAVLCLDAAGLSFFRRFGRTPRTARGSSPTVVSET